MDQPEGRVLIVDDAPSNLSALDSILKDQFTVSAAPGGEEALELLDGKASFDIFLLDVMMPGMDGYELCRRIKLLAAHKDVPVIFVTSMSDPKNEELGFALGAVDYILKPYNPLLVKARVRTHIAARRQHLNLESIVAERTQEFLKAKEEAEKANKAKTQFLANISHELRTPLNGITGMIQLLQETGLTSEQKELVGHMNTSCKRLNSLLTALMQLSTLDAGAILKDSRPFDLRACLDLLASIYAKMADRKNLAFTMKVHEALSGRFMGDRAALVQILSNLLDNALKYTREGGVEVRVTPMKTPEGESGDALWISFAVRDSGVGIEEDDLPGLFRSFAISEDYLHKELDGPGLGLSLTKRLAGLLGGKLHASSRPGQGSLFRVELPFERV